MSMSKVKSARMCQYCGAPLAHLAATCPYCGGALPTTEDSRPDKKGRRESALVSWALRFIPELHGRRLRRQFELVRDDPRALVDFFEQNLGAVRRVVNGELHKKVCEEALIKLRAFSRSDPELARALPQLQGKLDAAGAVNNRKGLRLLI